MALALCCAVILGSGCAKTVVSPAPRPPQAELPRADISQTASMLAAAENALAAGDMPKAEQISSLLARRPDLSAAETPRAWRVLALSALANRHPFVAADSLERWRAAQPQAENTPEWLDSWHSAMKTLPLTEAKAKARAVAGDENRSWKLRGLMVQFLAVKQWEGGELAQGLDSLAAFYGASSDQAVRAVLEQQLYAELHTIDITLLETLAGHVQPETRGQYPHALVALEAARRMLQLSDRRSEAREQIALLRKGSQLVSTGIFDDARLPEPQLAAVVPVGHGVALALPLSGQAGLVGSKIRKGAQIAEKEFSAAGYRFGVTVIDTEQPDWLEQMRHLPESIVIAGGLLRQQEYAAAKTKGLASRRAIFAFLPNIGEDEGSLAWRFFPSVTDQMDALFRVAHSLGVTSYAMLLPDDAFGRRMGDVFADHAAAKGSAIVRQAKYPPNDQESWNKLIGSFLNTNKDAEQAPSVPFHAIFLPDAWKNMELIIPNIFYYRETRQLLLGTSLWEQGLSGMDRVDARYYSIAVFPGAWRAKNLPPAGMKLRNVLVAAGDDEPDFWVGLGYDFVKFAATLDIKPDWTSEAVNALLSGHRGIPWAMAPVRWSGTGKAAQELYLFTPDSTGFSPADMEGLRRRFEKAWQ